MSAVGGHKRSFRDLTGNVSCWGRPDVPRTWLELPVLAEGVEKVSASRFLETMIQFGACERINVAQWTAVMNDHCEISDRSDLFNTLSHFRTFG